VQNKMHWAAHGHTAAEIVHERADGEKPFMGMQTTRPGGVVRKADAAIAKNYLTEPELQVLHRIVNLYIEFAELQALERKPMTIRPCLKDVSIVLYNYSTDSWRDSWQPVPGVVLVPVAQLRLPSIITGRTPRSPASSANAASAEGRFR